MLQLYFVPSFVLNYTHTHTHTHTQSLSSVQLFVTPQAEAHQAPLSIGFSRQEYWSGVQFPTPGDLPDPGIEPSSLASPALAGEFLTTSTTWETRIYLLIFLSAKIIYLYFLIEV